MPALRLATRGSPLARTQAARVAARLEALDPSVRIETVVVETVGDRRRDVPLAAIAGRGVFSTEVDLAVLEHRADLAVHSAKDLPAASSVPGLLLAAFPERADARDALVGSSLAALAPGGVVATGAPRRRVQLANLRPDLSFTELRGNIATRLDRVPDGGAVVVAMAAIERLDLGDRLAEVLETSTMLPQVGQGAIALSCRADDESTMERAMAIDDDQVHRAVLAERAFLAHLGGGCEAPVGAHATVAEDGTVHLEAMIASLDGHVVLRRRTSGPDAAQVGHDLAAAMLELDGADALVGQR